MMVQKTEENAAFKTADNLTLFYRKFTADHEKANVVIAHGLGEHSGRYGNVVDRLLHSGLTVWVMDHRGHGRSEGPRGHVKSFDNYLDDLRDFVLLAQKESPEPSKFFLLGHSMGGLMAIHFGLRHADLIDGLVISSPALGVTAEVPAAKLMLGKIMSVIWPGLSLSNELDPGKISHDKTVVETYKNDPMVHDRVSARWVTEFFNAMDAANQSASKIQTPVLMQIAGNDHLVNAEASVDFFNRLSAGDKTMHLYDDLYHECYNEKETDRNKVLNDLETWIMAHM